MTLPVVSFVILVLDETRLCFFIVHSDYPPFPSAPETPHDGPHQANHLGAGATGPILPGGAITNDWVSHTKAFLNPSLMKLFRFLSLDYFQTVFWNFCDHISNQRNCAAHPSLSPPHGSSLKVVSPVFNLLALVSWEDHNKSCLLRPLLDTCVYRAAPPVPANQRAAVGLQVGEG